MSRILTIDRGNTATKIKVLDGSEQLYAATCLQPDMDMLSGIVSQYRVDVGALCCVGHIDARLVESLRLLFHGSLLVLTPETSTPIQVSYATPRTLGADRVAAACGANALYPGRSLLVADAGTALTLDYINAGGCFMGGNISAGICLKLRVLHEFTAALPEVSPSGSLPELGVDTHTALRSGAVRGTAAEIIDTLHRLQAHDACVQLIITGGDAPLLKPLLPSDTIYHPDLISTGLISILKHNEYI